MARPPQKPASERWEHKTEKNCYCEERGGLVRTVINVEGIERQRRNTKLLWKPENKKDALKILDERLRDFKRKLYEIKNPVSKKTGLLDAITLFATLTFPGLSPHTVFHYKKAFEHYLPGTNVEMTVEKLRSHIEKQIIEHAAHSPNTRRKHLAQVSKLMDFCVERDYLAKNPVLKSMKPKTRYKEVIPFKQSELQLIYDAISASANIKGQRSFFREKHQLRLYIKFMSLTGCRATEAITLRWSDVSDDAIRIDGKRNRIDEPKVRHFPIDIVPGVRELLKELRQYSEINEGKLFPWEYTEDPRRRFRKVLIDLELYNVHGQTRSIHELRKTATNWWEKTLGIPADICAIIGGHDIATRQSTYNKKPSAQEIIEMVEKRGIAVSNPFQTPKEKLTETGENSDIEN